MAEEPVKGQEKDAWDATQWHEVKKGETLSKIAEQYYGDPSLYPKKPWCGNGSGNTQGVPARFVVMPCLGAVWGSNYLAQLRHFIQFAGLGVLEHDGSYPGDQCASTNHPFHHGLADSQWVQWKAITGLYQWCRANGVYLNIPDWYFLNGATKTGMGYREVNWSLPRAYQEIIERQNIFDGTWEKTPRMGWKFVPLTEYHGGGPAATIEPLKDHLPHYRLTPAERKQLSKLPPERAWSISESRPMTKPPTPQALKRTP